MKAAHGGAHMRTLVSVALLSLASAAHATSVVPPRERRALVRGYGIRELPGRLILGKPTDGYIANAGRPPRVRGLFDVVVHGNQHNVGIQNPDGSWIDLDAVKLAAEIRRSRSWNGKRPIRLLSCYVGADSIDVAQQLANELKVQVYAPTGYISLTPDAKSFGMGFAPTKAATLADFRLLEPRGS